MVTVIFCLLASNLVSTAPTTWVTGAIDSRGWVGEHASMAVSPKNEKLRMAYFDLTNTNLKLALEGEQVFFPLVKR